MDLANEIDLCEELMWAVEERIEVSTEPAKRNRWVAELARLDQELAELRTYAC